MGRSNEVLIVCSSQPFPIHTFDCSRLDDANLSCSLFFSLMGRVLGTLFSLAFIYLQFFPQLSKFTVTVLMFSFTACGINSTSSQSYLVHILGIHLKNTYTASLTFVELLVKSSSIPSKQSSILFFHNHIFFETVLLL